MVKVKRPLFSQDATGKLGSELQIQPWKGRHVIGRRRRPKQPRTEAQISHRHLMGFLANQWKLLDQAARATWTPIAAQLNASNYNAFISENMRRYRSVGVQFSDERKGTAFPTKTFPTDQLLLPCSFSQWHIFGLQLAIRFDYIVSTLRDNWGIAIHHAWHPQPHPHFASLITTIPITEAGAGSFTISGLKPGLYRTMMQRFSHDGRPWQWWIMRQAIVTPEGSPPEHPGPPQPPPPPPTPF